MRNLATIQTIKEIVDITGKDRIGLAVFDNVGFKVIVSKTELKAGDKVIYFEVDSLLPDQPEFEFLRSRCWNDKFQGHRIRAMKMGGIYSEGLALPISHFPSIITTKLNDGFDITSLLSVRKYDPEAIEEERCARLREEKRKSKRWAITKWLLTFVWFRWLYFTLDRLMAPKKKNTWPKFIHKTDETRVQSLTYVFEHFQGLDIYVTEKLDGQSVTFAIADKEFYVCSRNFRLKRDDSKYWYTATKYAIEKTLRQAVKDYGFDIAIQAEQCGPGIQGNKYGFEDTEIYIFNIFNVKSGSYFGLLEIQEFCQRYNLAMVPLIEQRKFDWTSVEQLLQYADGYSIKNKKTLREGIVIRSTKTRPPESKMANMWSLKVISPSFVIKHQDNNYSDPVK